MKKAFCDVCGNLVADNYGAKNADYATGLRSVDIAASQGQTLRLFIQGKLVPSGKPFDICGDCLSHAASLMDMRPRAAK